VTIFRGMKCVFQAGKHFEACILIERICKKELQEELDFHLVEMACIKTGDMCVMKMAHVVK
jgi:hypothetical protein